MRKLLLFFLILSLPVWLAARNIGGGGGGGIEYADTVTVGTAGDYETITEGYAAAKLLSPAADNKVQVQIGEGVLINEQPTFDSPFIDIVSTAEFYVPPIDEYVKLLIHCNGVDAATSFPDSSTENPKTLSAANQAQVDTADKKFGSGSLLVDGSGDYISAPASADWNFGSGDFTIDFWLKGNAVSDKFPIGTWGNGGSNSWGIIYRRSGNILSFIFHDGSEKIYDTSGFDVAPGAWYHVAVERYGSNISIYVNGTRYYNKSDYSGTFTDPGAATLRIGSSGGQDFSGWIDEVRISKGIARYQAAETIDVPVAEY